MPTTVEFLRNEKNPLLFAAGQVIFHQGDAGDVMYGVVEGTVELLRQGTVIATLGPGEVFGEMAILDRQPRSADAVAKTDVKLAPVDERRFLMLVQNHPYFALTVMRIMAERLRR